MGLGPGRLRTHPPHPAPRHDVLRSTVVLHSTARAHRGPRCTSPRPQGTNWPRHPQPKGTTNTSLSLQGFVSGDTVRMLQAYQYACPSSSRASNRLFRTARATSMRAQVDSTRRLRERIDPTGRGTRRGTSLIRGSRSYQNILHVPRAVYLKHCRIVTRWEHMHLLMLPTMSHTNINKAVHEIKQAKEQAQTRGELRNFAEASPSSN